MKNILLVINYATIFYFAFLTAALFAQAPDTLWTKTFGGSKSDFSCSVQQTTDGGYIITGTTLSFSAGYNDFWLIKTDGCGDTLWTKTFGGGDYELGSSGQQTYDGGYIIIGTIGFFRGVGLIKTDSSGDTLWTKTFRGRDYAWANFGQQTSDSGYIIISTVTELFSFTPDDLWLIKTDSYGDTLWTKTFGEIDIFEWGNSVQQTSDGGYIIIGTKSYYGDVDKDLSWLIKTDGNGDTLWTKIFGGSSGDRFNSVQQTTDGGYIITGCHNNDVWLIKTDGNGDTLWTKIFGGTDYDYGNFVQQTTDGGYIIIGITSSYGAGDDDVWLIKTDAAGDTLWTKTLGGNNGDLGSSVQQTTDGGYIITGSTESFGAGERDVWLIKLAPDITAIDQKPKSVINDYQLHQNYPNPFNPATTIEFALPKPAFVTLKVYNLLGEEVATLVAEQRSAGIHKLNWDARELASGVYLYRLEAGGFVQSKKLILLR